MIRNRTVSLLLVGLFSWLTGCTTYKQIQPADVSEQDHVVVTTTDGERRSLYDPEVVADSIRGKVERKSQVTQTYPLDQVAEVKSVGTRDVGTGAVIIVLGLGLLVVGIGSAVSFGS